MRVLETFPEVVRTIENLWIPVRDGTRLAARMWLPRSAEQTPVPAVLEYMPYRKRDFTRLRDEPLHHYFAGHGYAAIRLDLRGTGDAEGVVLDEYLEQEQDDAVDAIAWIRRQPWCNGQVGMMGLSWGGFNALQVAARRPEGLRAILTLCSTDDRYADDVHYKGGCLLNENLTWGSVFFSQSACPPDPQIAGPGWRKMWQQRLESNRLFPAIWLRHPHRDDYWRHGSVCEDYTAIECAVYAVGGWADGYVNAIPRLMAGLQAPRKALIGPWPHAFPHAAVPGPRIGMFQEAVRWWDYWLKGIDTGIMDEPQMRVWMEEWVPPSPHLEERPGRWVAEAQWPSPRISPRHWHLGVGALSEDPAAEDAVRVSSPQTAGLKGGEFYGYGAEGEGPLDQREDDGKSLFFDTDPLPERLEILGAPQMTVEIVTDRPVAQLIARLNDVAPDGASARVSYGVLNLTHRDGHEHPQPLVPGQRYRIRIPFNDIAYAFPAGHTIRLSLSTAYWPLLWPAPEPVTITVHTGPGSSLSLPIRPPCATDAELTPFAPPERGPGGEAIPLERADPRRRVEHDLTRDETVYTTFGDAADLEGAALARLEEIDLAVGHTIQRTFRIAETDPLSARAELEQRTRLHRGDWDVRIHCWTSMSATAEHFRVTAELEAFENEERIFHRCYDEWIPRRLV